MGGISIRRAVQLDLVRPDRTVFRPAVGSKDIPSAEVSIVQFAQNGGGELIFDLQVRKKKKTSFAPLVSIPRTGMRRVRKGSASSREAYSCEKN